MRMAVRLERMTAATAAALLEGKRPSDIRVAEDYPTEFSVGVAAQVAAGGELGPYVIYAPGEPIVVGEIGGAFTHEGTVEIGYAVVPSRWGRGIATDAVRELLRRIGERPDVERVVAHTPLDRPGSARVVEKAGFAFVREVEDTHEGVVLRVKEWEIRPRGGAMA
jgi:RimJ/RimL family protein N-acetyltransferase